MRGNVRLVVLVMLALVAFAANSVLARLAFGGRAMGPGSYSGVRLIAGALMLVGLVAARGQSLELRQALRSRTRWWAAAALFCYAIAFSIAYLALGAGTGALILFATVQFTILGWALFKGDRPGFVAPQAPDESGAFGRPEAAAHLEAVERREGLAELHDEAAELRCRGGQRLAPAARREGTRLVKQVFAEGNERRRHLGERMPGGKRPELAQQRFEAEHQRLVRFGLAHGDSRLRHAPPPRRGRCPARRARR